MKAELSSVLEFAANIIQVYLENKLKAKSNWCALYGVLIGVVLSLIFVVVIFLNFWLALEVALVLYLISLNFTYLGCSVLVVIANLLCLLFLFLYLKNKKHEQLLANKDL